MGRPPLNHAVVVAALLAGASAAVLAAARAMRPDSSAALYVDASAASGGDGSLEHPFKTLAPALAAGDDGREIRVAAGTYPGSLGSPQERDGKRYLIRGGYPPGSRFAARDPARFPTVVVGTDAARPVIELANADAVTIDGLQLRGPGTSGILAMGWRKQRTITITNCVLERIGDEAHAQSGAGAHLQAKTILFANNRVENTVGGRFGGAVSIGHPEGEAGAEATVRQNTIVRNVAVTSGIHGAGLLLGSSGRIDENVIDGNVMKSSDGSGPGGGVIIIGDGVRVTVTRNLITNNRSETAGGGLFVDDGASAVLENDVIVGNRAGRGGSGVGVDGSTQKRGALKLVNCTIANNGQADSPLGEGLSVENSDAEVVNTIFWGNGRTDIELVNGGKVALSCSHVAVKPGAGVSRGPGLTDGDPTFVAAGRGNYALAPDSPLRGAGCPGTTPAVDFLGRPRGGGRADLGAYAVVTVAATAAAAGAAGEGPR